MGRFFFFSLFVFLSLAPIAKANHEADLYRSYSQIVDVSPSTKESLNAVERKQLFQFVLRHPVADVDKLDKYDPKGFIGFCFGRSLTGHLQARRMGLKETSIRSLFIVGDLRSNPATPEWRFHVTTLVKGEDRKWHAIDPIMTPPLAAGKDLPVADWIRIVKKTWDFKKNSYLYVTSAAAVIPDIRVDSEATTGKNLIEIDFRAEEQEGFHSFKLEEFTAYQPDSAREQVHFLQPTLGSADNRFEFLQIRITGMGAVSFNKYFTDLFHSFETPSSLSPSPAPVPKGHLTKVGAKAAKSLAGGTNLHSFRLRRP